MNTLKGKRTAKKCWAVNWAVKQADKNLAKWESNENKRHIWSLCDCVISLIQREISVKLNKRSVIAKKRTTAINLKKKDTIFVYGRKFHNLTLPSNEPDTIR